MSKRARKRQPNPGPKKTPAQWMALTHTFILDPDGWRSGCHWLGIKGPKSWHARITLREYRRRSIPSTQAINRARYEKNPPSYYTRRRKCRVQSSKQPNPRNRDYAAAVEKRQTDWERFW